MTKMIDGSLSPVYDEADTAIRLQSPPAFRPSVWDLVTMPGVFQSWSEFQGFRTLHVRRSVRNGLATGAAVVPCQTSLRG